MKAFQIMEMMDDSIKTHQKLFNKNPEYIRLSLSEIQKLTEELKEWASSASDFKKPYLGNYRGVPLRLLINKEGLTL